MNTKQNEPDQVDSTELSGIANRFINFCKRFKGYFKNKSRDLSKQANQYLKGLMQSEKKNMERMAEVIPDSDEQSLHHFISNSDWDDKKILDQVGADADRIFDGQPGTCLFVDETGFPKKGKKSVGVARQWCGRLGKVENCQVGVFSALGRGNKSVLIDKRLYLPKEWTDDKERCLEAGIPYDEIIHKTKPELAFELVLTARQRKIRFDWVGVDGLYGNDPSFLRNLEDITHEVFVADVHKDQRVYLEDPKPIIPERTSLRGKQPTKIKAQCDPIRVDEWTKQQKEEAWQKIILRDSTKGEVVVNVLHKRVWLWDNIEEKARCWYLIVRREIDSPETIKYTLSNAPEGTHIQQLAFMQGQRYWIEQAIKEGKSNSGLGDYQVRGWRGWHHHIALVIVALLFMLEERVLSKKTYPLLSCSDIEYLLKHFLPKRNISEKEVIIQIKKRHKKRKSSINSAYRRKYREPEII